VELAKIILEYIKALIWPSIILILSFSFRKQIYGILNRVKKADLPGGISIETFPTQLEEARKLSIEVKKEEKEKEPIKDRKHPSIPLTEANARTLNLGLTPSSSGLELSHYRRLAEQDPNLALAGFRIETETMLKNLAKGWNVAVSERDSAGFIASKLKERGAITSRQYEFIMIIIKLCNAAIHGQKVTIKQVNELLDIADVLVDQYVAWLSWGFPNK